MDSVNRIIGVFNSGEVLSLEQINELIRSIERLFNQGNIINLEIEFTNGRTLSGRYSSQDQLNRISFYNNIIRRSGSLIINGNLLRANRIKRINLKNVRERAVDVGSSDLPTTSRQALNSDQETATSGQETAISRQENSLTATLDTSVIPTDPEPPLDGLPSSIPPTIAPPLSVSVNRRVRRPRRDIRDLQDVERLWTYPEQFSEEEISKIVRLIRSGPLKLGVAMYQNDGSRIFAKLRGNASNLQNFIEILTNKYSGNNVEFEVSDDFKTISASEIVAIVFVNFGRVRPNRSARDNSSTVVGFFPYDNKSCIDLSYPYQIYFEGVKSWNNEQAFMNEDEIEYEESCVINCLRFSNVGESKIQMVRSRLGGYHCEKKNLHKIAEICEINIMIAEVGDLELEIGAHNAKVFWRRFF